MKKCPNNHDNPDNAQFCRICGHRFIPMTSIERIVNIVNGILKKLMSTNSSLFTTKSYAFTPDAFPSISLSPCSVVGVKFNVSKGLISCIICIVLGICILMFRDEAFRIANLDNERTILKIAEVASGVTSLIFFIVASIKILRSLLRLYKWQSFNFNADYIESREFVKNHYRIAKNCKLGLFEKGKNSVVLRTIYDNISSLDSNHLLVEEKGKLGLYSLNTKGLIIPVKYDKISEFVNSIATCQKGNTVYHYDVNGNKLK